MAEARPLADLLPPNKAFIKQALTILEEEGIAEYFKHELKERLFQLDLVAVDPDMISAEVIAARDQALQIDWFMTKLKGYVQ